MKSKGIIIFLLSIVTAISYVCMISCGKEDVEQANVEFTISFESKQVTVGEQFKIRVNEENLAEYVKFSSENPEVASVTESGNVLGVSIGTAKIVAKLSSCVQYCVVTVIENAVSDEYYTVILDKISADLVKGSHMQLTATVYKNRLEVDERVSFDFDGDCLENKGIQGNTVTVFGKSYGKTDIIASIGGFTAICTVNVCRNISIRINDQPLKITKGQQLELDYDIYEDGVLLSDTTGAVVSTDDDYLISVDGDRIVGRNYGKTFISVSFADVTKKAEIEIYEKIIKTSLNIYVIKGQTAAYTFTEKDDFYGQTISSVVEVIDRAPLPCEIAENTISFTANTFDGFDYGIYDYYLVAEDETKYQIKISLATQVIKTPTELKTFLDNTRTGQNNNYAGEYVILANDIDMTGISLVSTNYNTRRVFAGTLDGCGYAISDLKLSDSTSSGLFREISTTGVVKNVALINIETPSAESMGILCIECKGTVENVYVAGSITTSSATKYAGGVARIIYATGVVRNCVVNVDISALASDNNGVIVGSFNSGANINNCYGISTKLTSISASGAGTANKSFNDAAAFFAEVTDLPEANGWSDFWEINGNGLSFGGKLIIEK